VTEKELLRTGVATANLLDLARYPIDDLDSLEGRDLVERCRADLAASGACQLDGFITPDAIETLAVEARQLAPLAFYQDDTHNVYFEDIDESLPDDDPRRILQHSSSAAVAYDQIPGDAIIRQIYEWDPLLHFVGAALSIDPFYRNEDPLGACNVIYYGEGDELGWHFDRAEFVVTLMIQAAEEGGGFEYIPWLRSDEDENYDGVGRLLRGDRSDVIELPSKPGTLALFRGRRSIHRVPHVKGSRLRTNAVLSYADQPGKKLNEYTQRLFYGRTA